MRTRAPRRLSDSRGAWRVFYPTAATLAFPLRDPRRRAGGYRGLLPPPRFRDRCSSAASVAGAVISGSWWAGLASFAVT
ncbi:hypothetical protein NDU88_011433 [Pleurodeles waltl]|uniref:Uncharacterized protein n=1 Tax=Pleurodeles waltl TaxID=8319 RepID=A0AAV7Q0R2_PLEWA|nr:hypothetical protein NDU88_011433 [Pleurodeles waltl]